MPEKCALSHGSGVLGRDPRDSCRFWSPHVDKHTPCHDLHPAFLSFLAERSQHHERRGTRISHGLRIGMRRRVRIHPERKRTHATPRPRMRTAQACLRPQTRSLSLDAPKGRWPGLHFLSMGNPASHVAIRARNFQYDMRLHPAR